MIKNEGHEKEAILVDQINMKTFKDLDANSQQIVSTMFKNVKNDDLVEAGLVEDYIKPDFFVSINKEMKYVSMKSGSNTIVHQEYIVDFCKYLNSIGISKETTDTILKYHYSDGTTDGTGKERLSYSVNRANLELEIKKANKELNSDRELVVNLFTRFVFKGKKEENLEADFIYHGEPNYGIIVSKRQILKHVEIKTFGFYEALHIGPILFRPHARYYNKAIGKEQYRQRVEFYWPNMVSELIYIKSHYF